MMNSAREYQVLDGDEEAQRAGTENAAGRRPTQQSAAEESEEDSDLDLPVYSDDED